MGPLIRKVAAWFAAGCISGLLAVQVLMIVATPAAAVTWSDTNCTGTSWSMTAWRRADAQAYAERADHEGYEWNGGCYKLNDRDDTPGAPDSDGEGADCSGFTFKSWALKSASGASGFFYWMHEKNIHGPYYTSNYYSPASTDPFKLLDSKTYAATQYMDAFVYRINGAGHIGMVYLEGSGGSDYIVEAKSDDLGTRISYTNYRSQSAYRAVARKGWTPDCYPNCV
jgi:hypothetical protein